MQPAVGQPWFHSALERLDVRPRDRLLAIDSDIDETYVLSQRVGNRGELTVVQRDLEAAEKLAEKFTQQNGQKVRVLAHEVGGSETFGTFDSLLIVPATGPLLGADDYAHLIRQNLRPGGRFVIDLPAENMVPDLRAAWFELGWDEERLAPLCGPSDVELAEALRDAGLRSVHAALGSHLLHLPAPADLVDAFAVTLTLDEEERVELSHGILRKRQAAGPLDALVHRTQVGGQR